MGQSLIIQGIVSKLLLYSSTSTTGRSGTNQRFFAVDLLIYIYIYIYIYFIYFFFFYRIYEFIAKQLSAGSPEQNISGSGHARTDSIHVKNQKQAL